MTAPIRDTFRMLVSESNPEVSRTRSDFGGCAQQARIMAEELVAWMSAPAAKKLPGTKTCGECRCFSCKCSALGQRPGQRVCRFPVSEFTV